MPLSVLSKPVLNAALLGGAALALAGCGRGGADPDAANATTAAAQAAATEAAAPAAAATPTAIPPSESRDPKQVLVAWAKAMSLNDWDSAWLYWGEQGTASGLTREQFRAKWGKLKDPQFDIYPGQGEGAAGSSYYTAPLVLIDGKRRVKGEIVLRRVNDVRGATAEQLRWHIEKLTIEP